MKLICLPYGGSSSAPFYKWKKFLTSNLTLAALDYPGHGTRSREPLILSYDEMIENMYYTYRDEFKEPFILFGHSVGALIAYGLTHKLENEGTPPNLLLVSGRRPPHLPKNTPNISHLNNESFIREIQKRYGWIPPKLMEDIELQNQFIPILRAGFVINESFIYKKQKNLQTPLKAFVAENDPYLSYEIAQEWSKMTDTFLGTKIIPGDHLSCLSSAQSIQLIIDSINAIKLS